MISTVGHQIAGHIGKLTLMSIGLPVIESKKMWCHKKIVDSHICTQEREVSRWVKYQQVAKHSYIGSLRPWVHRVKLASEGKHHRKLLHFLHLERLKLLELVL